MGVRRPGRHARLGRGHQPGSRLGFGADFGVVQIRAGVRSVSPGYETWLVEPQPGDLTWAKGRVPTPHGAIEVRWEKEGNEFVLLIEVPDGTLGTAGVPVRKQLCRLKVTLKIERTSINSGESVTSS